MPDLVLRADPAIWSQVPFAEEALAWRDARLANVSVDRQPAVREAATLALRTRAEVDATHVLFLDDVEHRILAALAVFAYDDVPPASGQVEAEAIARAMVPSAWEPLGIPVGLDAISGWRITVVDAAPSSADQPGAVADAVWTVYVLDARGRCVVALLSAMAPLNAAAAQIRAEAVLSTLEVVDGEPRVR